MNNEELKKKIIEIMSNVWSLPVPCTAERKFERIADALIAAGIGDVKEAEKEYRNGMLMAIKSQTISSERSRYMELNKNIAEHRAEVAERMAKNACSIVFTREIDDKDWAEVIYQYKEEHGLFDEVGITDDMLYDYLKEQAEKELAEEK